MDDREGFSPTAMVAFDATKRQGITMFQSGYFADVKSAEQAYVKIVAGAELGLAPFASMTGIHIIKGKPTLSANLIATLIKNDPRYNYRIANLDDAGCTIVFFENSEEVGVSTFTAQDAKKAQLGGVNWQKFPRNMYFARAISNGAKWYTPGIFGGAPVYTPDELGADVDEDGNIIDAGPQWTVEPDEVEPAPSNNTQGPETPEPVKATVTDEPLFNGNTADARAWLEEKGPCTLGVVADALVMTGLYNDRKHVANALDGKDGAELREKGLKVDMRCKVNATLMIFDWAVDRKAESA